MEMTTHSRFLIALLLVTILMATLGAVVSWAGEAAWTTAAVTLRAGPGAGHDVVAHIGPCAALAVTELDGKWYRVEWSGRDGWVAAKYVSIDAGYCDGYNTPAGDSFSSNY
jgi:uncharacterized protein YraI